MKKGVCIILPDILDAKEVLQQIEQEKLNDFTGVNGTDILQQFYEQGITHMLK